MPTITATIEIADRSEKRSPRINTPARTETTVVRLQQKQHFDIFAPQVQLCLAENERHEQNKQCNVKSVRQQDKRRCDPLADR